ncbi:hypothetical protein GWK74_02970 [Candidatus Saccharibacteria bacterium oral taxon 488]|nr:hypothetical protein GWK74_02765 [Candidatus Saccharibacteria bacterium oral taxon 488]QHU90467.1 hypothetical protein GWK74_02970 [Candidatus Saccharibacteria bacterium oral taxon 488]
MKRYRLIKDLPTFKAGDMFYMSKYGDLIYDSGDVGITAYARQALEKFPNILKEWFEEIQEPTDSIHWKPEVGEGYWSYYSDGEIRYLVWSMSPWDIALYKMGMVYRTSGECKKARDRKLAEARLRRTSTFKPDFKNDNGGWVVYYDPREKRLEVQEVYRLEYGEIVRYETEEDAEKSIEENEQDWLIYFGIKERE